MCPLLKAVLVAALCEPTFLLTPPREYPPTVGATPSIRLRFDPWTMSLTWDCGNHTVAVACTMTTPDGGSVKVTPGKPCHCSFQNTDTVLHKGATLTVTVNSSQRLMTEKVVYVNAGGQNTAARNLSCVIYHVDFMNCTWAKGPAASDDTQYFLYLQDRKTRSQCPRYVTESGTHVGCHQGGVSKLRHQVYLLVNGTSRTAQVQFLDTFLLLKKIEIYDPPGNITVDCNSSHCLIRWERPRSHFSPTDRDFKYQLHIQRQDHGPQGDSQMVEVSGHSGNSYRLRSPEPRAKHTVRVRAADSRVKRWGIWSTPVGFGSGEREPSLAHLYLLLVLGTVACALTFVYLLRRFVRTPIPQVKDKLNEDTHEITWEKIQPAPTKGDNEEVLIIKEVGGATGTM